MDTNTPRRVLIMGAGSFGTAIALHIATLPEERAFDDIFLWSRSEDQARATALTGRNPRALTDIDLPRNITPIGGDLALASVADECPYVIMATAAQGARSAYERLSAAAGGAHHILSLAKGIEISSGMMMNDVARECVEYKSYTALSGPSHAEEVALGMPAAVAAASADEDAARTWQALLSDARLRIYTTGDVRGAELGGAVKNIIAIAVGIARAYGAGDNAAAALVTRGLSEMMSFGAAMGARPITLAGLAGIGDLMATCFSRLSRNLRFGMAIGEGRTAEEAFAEIGQVVEGAHTARAIDAMSREIGAELPITDGVNRIVYGSASIEEIMTELLAREPKPEEPR